MTCWVVIVFSADMIWAWRWCAINNPLQARVNFVKTKKKKKKKDEFQCLNMDSNKYSPQSRKKAVDF